MAIEQGYPTDAAPRDRALLSEYEYQISHIRAEIEKLQGLKAEDGTELYLVPNPDELAEKIYALRNSDSSQRLFVTDFDKTLTDLSSKPCFASLAIPPAGCTKEERTAVAEYARQIGPEFPEHTSALKGLQNRFSQEKTKEHYNQMKFIPGNVVSDAINSSYDVLVATGITAACELHKIAPQLLDKLVAERGRFPIRDGVRDLLAVFGETVIISGGITEIIEEVLVQNNMSVNAIIANSISQPPNSYNYVTPTNKAEKLGQYIQGKIDYEKEKCNLPQTLVVLGDDPNDMCMDRKVEIPNKIKILLHAIPQDQQLEEAYPGYPDFDIMVRKTEGLAKIAYLLDPNPVNTPVNETVLQ